jgi:exodeoxyribonuclease VII small subunit
MKRLEEIVRKLEEDTVPLEESIRLYEEGMKIGRKCKQILEDADKRIKELSSEFEEDGESD